MLLYVHVPFCRARCAYCAFYSTVLPKGEGAPLALETHVRGLLRELTLWERRLAGQAGETGKAGQGRGPVTSVFFGGGTPSLLEPEQVGRILAQADKSLGLARDAEITLEANPESLHDTARVQAFKDCGITRISLGIQSLDKHDLRVLGRIHSRETALQAVEAVHAADIALNVDLMWALPGQSLQAWLHNLESVAQLSPHHVSAYNLTLEEGTRLAQRYADQEKRAALPLPDEDEQEAMFCEGHALLAGQGFGHYEISNYAREGCACRHNLGYWQGEDYLGLGPAAVSTLGSVRIAHPEDREAWLQAVQGTEQDWERFLENGTEELDADTRLREYVMLSLRTFAGLGTARYRALCGHDFLEVHRTTVQALLAQNLATLSETGQGGQRFALSLRGMLVSNAIVERLFEDMDGFLAR